MPKTRDGRADKPSLNLLLDHPFPEKSNQVWAGDITFIPTASGWLHLAVVIDLDSHRIVGGLLANHMRVQLVTDALKQALDSRTTAVGLIFHSDRGSQYGSGAYRQLLAQAGMRQSMSARATPYHNAWTQSFMGTLKPKCGGTAASSTTPTPRPRSLITSSPTTTLKENTQHSDTTPRPRDQCFGKTRWSNP